MRSMETSGKRLSWAVSQRIRMKTKLVVNVKINSLPPLNCLYSPHDYAADLLQKIRLFLPKQIPLPFINQKTLPGIALLLLLPKANNFKNLSSVSNVPLLLLGPFPQYFSQIVFVEIHEHCIVP